MLRIQIEIFFPFCCGGLKISKDLSWIIMCDIYHSLKRGKNKKKKERRKNGDEEKYCCKYSFWQGKQNMISIVHSFSLVRFDVLVIFAYVGSFFGTP